MLRIKMTTARLEMVARDKKEKTLYCVIVSKGDEKYTINAWQIEAALAYKKKG